MKKRAEHAQVFCLTDWFYEEALDYARALDEILDCGGEPLGPLHGIPIGLKVRAPQWAADGLPGR